MVKNCAFVRYISFSIRSLSFSLCVVAVFFNSALSQQPLNFRRGNKKQNSWPFKLSVLEFFSLFVVIYARWMRLYVYIVFCKINYAINIIHLWVNSKLKSFGHKNKIYLKNYIYKKVNICIINDTEKNY